MAQFLKTSSLSYKDVNLIAQPSVVSSRKEIPIEMNRIVVSAMTSIIGPSFIKAIAELPEELQPTLHIPRDIFKTENLHLASTLGLKRIFVGVGLKEDSNYEDKAIHAGYKTAFIDIANGYLPQIPERIKQLKEKGFESIICGSVHTSEGARLLALSGVTVVRLGIAPGSVCITKDSTGFTRGTIAEIVEVANYKNYLADARGSEPFLIMADGGLKSPSDYVKAFLAGADYCMGGRIFTEAFECRMHTGTSVASNERSYQGSASGHGLGGLLATPDHKEFPINTYFGMASNWGKIAMGNPSDNIEGTCSIIKPQFYLKDIIETLWSGIASGVSYSGYNTLNNAIGNGIFEIIP